MSANRYAMEQGLDFGKSERIAFEGGRVVDKVNTATISAISIATFGIPGFFKRLLPRNRVCADCHYADPIARSGNKPTHLSD